MASTTSALRATGPGCAVGLGTERGRLATGPPPGHPRLSPGGGQGLIQAHPGRCGSSRLRWPGANAWLLPEASSRRTHTAAALHHTPHRGARRQLSSVDQCTDSGRTDLRRSRFGGGAMPPIAGTGVSARMDGSKGHSQGRGHPGWECDSGTTARQERDEEAVCSLARARSNATNSHRLKLHGDGA